MEITEIVIAVLEITFFLLLFTLLMSYLIYRLRKSSGSNDITNDLIIPGIRTDYQSIPEIIHPGYNISLDNNITEEEYFQNRKPQIITNDNPNHHHYYNNHYGNNYHNDRYKIVNYAYSDKPFNSQYFVPREASSAKSAFWETINDKTYSL